MPFVQRQKKLRDAFREVLLAPIYFVAFGSVTAAPFLLLTLCLLLFCQWVTPQPLTELVPTKQEFREFLVISVGMYCVIAFAAAILIVREYWAGQYQETMWESDDACLVAARQYATLLLDAESEALYENFSPGLQQSLQLSQFALCVDRLIRKLGRPTLIESVTEVAFEEPDDDFDAIVEVAFEHADAEIHSQMELYLSCRSDYEIRAIHLSADDRDFIVDFDFKQ